MVKVNPYKQMESNLDKLGKWFQKSFDENMSRSLLGKRTRGEIKTERRNRLFARKWRDLKATINNCCHCQKQPEVISNIDCGIDGGPGPVTCRGVKLKCNCGMSTDIHENYPSDDLQFECFKKAINQWNNYV